MGQNDPIRKNVEMKIDVSLYGCGRMWKWISYWNRHLYNLVEIGQFGRFRCTPHFHRAVDRGGTLKPVYDVNFDFAC